MPDSEDRRPRLNGFGKPRERQAGATQTPADPHGAHPGAPTVLAPDVKGIWVELKERIAALPEMDRERVERIKRAIARGEYRVDPHAIARKLMEIDGLLPGL